MYNFFTYRDYFKYLQCKFKVLLKKAILKYVFNNGYQQPCPKTINIASINNVLTTKYISWLELTNHLYEGSVTSVFAVLGIWLMQNSSDKGILKKIAF